MTNTSLVPEAAGAAGIKYDDLVERIALSARSGE
jgi:D-alanine-D-alanine ligase